MKELPAEGRARLPPTPGLPAQVNQRRGGGTGGSAGLGRGVRFLPWAARAAGIMTRTSLRDKTDNYRQEPMGLCRPPRPGDTARGGRGGSPRFCLTCGFLLALLCPGCWLGALVSLKPQPPRFSLPFNRPLELCRESAAAAARGLLGGGVDGRWEVRKRRVNVSNEGEELVWRQKIPPRPGAAEPTPGGAHWCLHAGGCSWQGGALEVTQLGAFFPMDWEYPAGIRWVGVPSHPRSWQLPPPPRGDVPLGRAEETLGAVAAA